MAIRNILVSYNAQPGAESALGVAMLMARKHDAHLTGILSYGPSRMAEAIGPWITPEILDQIKITETARRESIARAFNEATHDLEVERPGKVHWLDLGGDADDSLMEAARVYDIVVMGHSSAARETAHIAPHPDVIALRSGRPVLIVPTGYRTDRLVERALLAWDGGRASARAMADAMPLLESKSHVVVATVGDREQAMRHDGRDVVAHLARHGIHTEWAHLSRGKDGIAGALLEEAEAKAAGLMVMGAYEHSKFAEDIVGGVTKTLLAKARVPVLMSH